MDNQSFILQAMEERLSDDAKDMLRNIDEPTVVGVPLDDSRACMCVMKSGEIRAYGKLVGDDTSKNPGAIRYTYLSSPDCGISWTYHYSKGYMRDLPLLYGYKSVYVSPGTYIAEKDIYIGIMTVCETENKGTYAIFSKVGPDDDNPRIIKIADELFLDAFSPQKSRYSDRIWFTAQCREEGKKDGRLVPAYIYSDDFGENWQSVILAHPPEFTPTFPHKGMRWSLYGGTEPHAVEISKNKMMMIIRNSSDCFYQAFSDDGGQHWTAPEPSVFHGSNTTAFLLSLGDGRTINFWNNTQPMPEQNHEKQLPKLSEDEISGKWEDAFTNRDVNHVAITDDGGASWIGFRELHLNTIRNNPDFRYIGNPLTSLDKSVHQFQAFELPYGKVLVSMGQNEASRKLVIFDISWLYEKERKEDFLGGLKNVTTHVYLKSISGSWEKGHCAWNRTDGAVMMPNPDGDCFDNVYISKHHDERLLCDVQGVVWNFPASEKGSVTAEIKLMEKRVRISLADRWFNACDEYAASLSPFMFELDNDDIGFDFVKIRIDYDTTARYANVYSGEKLLFGVNMMYEAQAGISYIIIQCATDGDSKGLYLKRLEKRA